MCRKSPAASVCIKRDSVWKTAPTLLVYQPTGSQKNFSTSIPLMSGLTTPLISILWIFVFWARFRETLTGLPAKADRVGDKGQVVLLQDVLVGGKKGLHPLKRPNQGRGLGQCKFF